MANSVIKITSFSHGGISIKLFGMHVHTYHEQNFKPQISPIFHFEYVNEVWISGLLGVKLIKHFEIQMHKGFDFIVQLKKILEFSYSRDCMKNQACD